MRTYTRVEVQQVVDELRAEADAVVRDLRPKKGRTAVEQTMLDVAAGWWASAGEVLRRLDALAIPPPAPARGTSEGFAGVLESEVAVVREGGDSDAPDSHLHQLRILMFRFLDGTLSPYVEAFEGAPYEGARLMGVSELVHLMRNVGRMEAFEIGNREHDANSPERPESSRLAVGVVEYGVLLERHHRAVEQAIQRPRAVTPTPEVPALKPLCGDMFIPGNRHETASVCDLPAGHAGAHWGWVDGGRSWWEPMKAPDQKTAPTAPEVVWTGDGVRVLADGTLQRDMYDYGWRTCSSAAAMHGAHAMALARALAEAKRETAILKAAADGTLPLQSALRPSDMSNAGIWMGAAYSMQTALQRLRTGKVDLARGAARRGAVTMRERMKCALGDMGFDLSPRQVAVLDRLSLDDSGPAPAAPESELRAYAALVDAVRQALAQLRDGPVGRVGDAIATLSQALEGKRHG